MKDKILEALAQLDPLDDDQWTADGAPRVDVVEKIVGEDVKRQDIVDADPEFNREKASKADDEETDNTDEEAATDDAATTTDGGDGETKAAENDEDNADAETQGLPEGEGRQEEVTESAEVLTKIDRPLTEREFAAFLGDVPKEELEDVQAMLKMQLSEVQADITKIKDLEGRIKRSISMTSSRIKQEFPNSTETDAIRSFINAQTEQRAAKVARRQEILKGIDIKDLDPRAPIDAAMARKTKRGTSRPVRPLVK